MRLVNVRTKKLEEFLGAQTPRYAILSHTWGSNDEELTFQDVEGQSSLKQCLGKEKLDGCCAQAAKDDLDYVWIDTCCIDKTNSTELGEAINSMFRWYKHAARCYAYLADVPPGDDVMHPQSSFRQSRWFTRGWTLQELLAPRVMYFYDAGWNYLGDKRTLSSALVTVTGIPRHFLQGMVDLHEASVAQRMSWAARRTTSRTEDLAYCLLGIFNVSLPMMYGDGERAFRRLQEEILRTRQDDSIFAWGFSPTPSAEPPSSEPRPTSVLADSPSRFSRCGSIVPHVLEGEHSAFFSIAGGNLSMQRKVYEAGTGQLFIVLECCPNDDSTRSICIPVANSTTRSLAAGIERLNVCHSTLLPRDHESRVETVRFQLEPTHSPQAFSKQCLVSIDNEFTGLLELVDVVPRDCWSPDAETIISPNGANHDTRRLVVRFRTAYGDTPDLVILLDIEWQDFTPKVTPHVVTCSPNIEHGHEFSKLKSSSLSFHSTSIGQLDLGIHVRTEQLGRKSILEVRLVRHTGHQPTADVTFEAEHAITLQNLEASLRQDHMLCVQLTGMRTELESETNTLRSTEEALANMERIIQALQEEKSALLAKRVSAAGTNVRLSSEVAEKTSQRERLAQKIKSHLALIVQGRNESLDSATTDEWPTSIITSLSAWLPPVDHPGIDALPYGIGKLVLSAICSENLALFQLLAGLGLGAAVTDKHCDGLVTKLLLWAASNGRQNAISALLQIGANINVRDESGETPLGSAVRHGHDGTIQLLLDHGAEPSAPRTHDEDEPQTPLDLAASEGREAAIRILLENKADIESGGPKSTTPLAWAASKGREAAIRILLENGADIEARSPYLYMTPLALAASEGREVAMQILLENGADIEAKTVIGETPLGCAAARGADAAIRLLLDRGADVNANSPSGSPLVSAARAGKEASIQLLLDNGADITLQNLRGRTAFHLAVFNAHRKAAQLLMDHGAGSGEPDETWRRARAVFNWKDPGEKPPRARARKTSPARSSSCSSTRANASSPRLNPSSPRANAATGRVVTWAAGPPVIIDRGQYGYWKDTPSRG